MHVIAYGFALPHARCRCSYIRWLRRESFVTAVQDGWTPIYSAAYYGHSECVKVLLAAGADKEAKDKVSDC